ncbi:MAG TPA: hypothetical protein VJ623_05680 [Holophagaceae bacterium]|nr:hypothetical protein [Holophagaceae bacterium]
MTWSAQLERPDAGFFPAFAARIREEDGLREAVREAVKVLTPWVDWEAYQPHIPHALLGLRAAYRLRPLLPEKAFHRLVATQIHAFAHEGRKVKPAPPAQGAGSWRNLESFIQARKPGLAWMEAASFEQPRAEDFARLGRLVEADMANIGHKAVFAHHLGDLQEVLERPKATGRRLLGLTAWLAATPEDRFWHQRASKRLEGFDGALDEGPAVLDAEGQIELVREICDCGLVDLLNRLAARARAGLRREDLNQALIRAASEKLLDARRDLEGKTGWNFVFLATQLGCQGADPRLACQAAALVNLFPTEEAEDRLTPAAPRGEVSEAALLDAILDVEPPEAYGLALALFEARGPEAVLRALAEAASANDPAFNHSHQTLLVAAGADLAPGLPPALQAEMLGAMAKSLANSQGSSDLTRLAERALEGKIG